MMMRLSDAEALYKNCLKKKEVFILVLSDPSGYVNNKKDLNIRYKEIK